MYGHRPRLSMWWKWIYLILVWVYFCSFFFFFLLMRALTPLSRWWSCSLSISTSPGSMWWRWTRTARRTAARQEECRLSPSRRRSSSPSPPTRTPMYESDRTHEHVSPHQGSLHSHLGRFYFPTLDDGDILSRNFTLTFSGLLIPTRVKSRFYFFHNEFLT